MTNITRDNIPDLNIELMDDEQGSLILLEQDSGGNLDRVCIHPVQLRYMAEKFGIIPTSDPQAAKTIATLQRRLIALRDRVDHLSEWMAKHSDHDHADLSYETTQLHALQDLACEWCADFDHEDVGQADATTAKPPQLPEPVTQGSLL